MIDGIEAEFPVVELISDIDLAKKFFAKPAGDASTMREEALARTLEWDVPIAGIPSPC